MNFSITKNLDLQKQNTQMEGQSEDVLVTAGKPVVRTTTPFEAVSLALYNDLFAAGEQRALESGALKLTPADEESLTAHARAMAQHAKRELFDPTNDIADRLRADEFEKQLADRQEMEITAKHATAAFHAAEEEVAGHQIGAPPSAPTRALQWSAAIVIAISMAVTFHDQVLAFEDDVLAWLCAFLIGLLCGWFVTTLILYSTGTPSAIALVRRFGLVAGIAIGLGMFALRVAQNHSIGSFVFATGMTLLELGAVIGLDSIAHRYRTALEAFRERELVLMQAVAARDVAQKKLTGFHQTLCALETGIQAHINYINERRLRHQHVAELEALAIQGVRDGYAAGIAKNVGVLRTGKNKKGGVK